MPSARRARPRRKRAKKVPAQGADCPPAPLKPSGVKVRERPDNLEGRAEWFRKRTGA